MADVRIIDLTQGVMSNAHNFESDDGNDSYQISATDLKAYCQTGLTPQSIGIPAGVTTTELGYLDGVTSAIQTQLDSKTASGHTHPISAINNLQSSLSNKQDVLVSGTNIKTINTQSLLGSGDITISGGGVTSHGALTGLSSDDHTQYSLANGTRWTATPTANRVVVSDASGNIIVSSITTTILGYLSSVSSDIQTQINAKAPLANPAFTGTVTGITKAMVGLSAVENTALSTWTGSSSITTLGTIANGIWNGTAIGDTYISSASTWNAKQNALVSGTNIKTVNSQSLLGSGDITISGSVAWGNVTGTLSSQADLLAALNAKQNTITNSDSIVQGTTNLFLTSSERTKLTGIQAGAEVNVNPDWNATSGDGQILNKPTTLAGYQISDAQPLDSDLTAIAALTTTSFGRGILTQTDGAATRSYIGAGTSNFDGNYNSLSNIPTTFTPSSHNQNWSTITSTPTTLAGYGITDAQAFITAGTTAQYYRGDKTFQTLDKAAVGLALVENTALTTWTGSSSITTLGTIVTGIWNGTIISDTYISSAATWNAKQNALGFTPENITNKSTSLTSPDNTKYPTTLAVSNAISGFAPLANPTFTGTVNGITKSMVGLGDVDNTTDLNKPISSATQTALDGKNKTITSGTAAPSGGSDGDIYLQYT